MTLALIGGLVSEKKMFESNGYIHVYMYTCIYTCIQPLDRCRQPPEVNVFHEQYYSVNIVLCCKFSSIKCLYNSFPHSNVQMTQFDLP